MTEERAAQLKAAVLRVLARSGEYLVPEQALLEEVRVGVTPRMLSTEFRRTIDALDVGGYIHGERPPLGGAPKWKITAEGRAALADQ